MHRIVGRVASCMECRLKIDSPDSRVPDGEIDNLSDLVFINAPLDRRDDRHVETESGQPVERKKLLVQDAGFAPERATDITRLPE